MAAPVIVDLDSVKTWLGPGHPEAIVDSAYKAAHAWVLARVQWWAEADATSPPEAPDDLKHAVRLQTARMIARRNSPDGMIGIGDLGFTRITITDQDVASLINPWRVVVIA